MARRKRRRLMKKSTRNRLILVGSLFVFAMIIRMLFVVITGLFNQEEVIVKDVEDKEIRVSFMGVGDNLIHDTIYRDAQNADGSYDFSGIFEGISSDIKNSDIAFINQETIAAGQELGLSGYPMFNSPSELVSDLDSAGFDLVNLASNHSLDRHQEGIESELAAFEKTDIVVDGIYDSKKAYDSIVTFKKKGITFSFLSYTYGTNGISPDYDYSVSYFDEAQIRKDVAKAKKQSDVIIVSAHWGDENSFVPNEFQTYYAKLFADLGVDVVIGTHSHTIQPVQWIEGKDDHKMLCVYSLGNFVSDMAAMDNMIGGEIKFDFVKKNQTIKIENVRWIPTITHAQRGADGYQHGFIVYRYDQYTDALASVHGLNGLYGEYMSLDHVKALTQEVIDAQFLGDYFQ